MTLTIIFALAAALSNAIHLMTQHTASTGVTHEHRNWHLVRYLIRQPLWLLGWAAAAGGFAFQALALHGGQLAVVQSLLVTELVFALLLRRFWVRQHIAKTAWTAALVTSGRLWSSSPPRSPTAVTCDPIPPTGSSPQQSSVGSWPCWRWRHVGGPPVVALRCTPSRHRSPGP